MMTAKWNPPKIVWESEGRGLNKYNRQSELVPGSLWTSVELAQCMSLVLWMYANKEGQKWVNGSEAK
jgi:hypothetical protein